MPPRTIDNLGVDVSTRYAEDQKILDESLVKESQAIPVQAGIEVTAPYFPTEIDALLHILPSQITWASFTAPSLYFEQRKRLFTYQLIPSMGSEDKQESQALKVLNKLKSVEQKTLENQDTKDKRQLYEEGLALEEEEKEKKVLTSLLNTISHFDKLIIEVNSKRNQYQKG